jgi:hypothetical protein
VGFIGLFLSATLCHIPAAWYRRHFIKSTNQEFGRQGWAVSELMDEMSLDMKAAAEQARREQRARIMEKKTQRRSPDPRLFPPE